MIPVRALDPALRCVALAFRDGELFAARGEFGFAIADRVIARLVFDAHLLQALLALETQTGGRLARVAHLIEGDTFLANYCDGLSDVDLDELVGFHRSHGKIGTITGFHPHSKYGIVKIDGAGTVTYFQEKPLMNDLTSGGFFVFNRRLFDYLSTDESCILEHVPFNALAKDGQMALFVHGGFWQCMDTFKDVQAMNALWSSGEAPWKRWLT